MAEELLDMYLITVHRGERCGGRIVETEAYLGSDDKASHAASGPTGRSSVMFETPGSAYVYICYGMHRCFNIVCEKEGVPGAVLIRAVEPEIGTDIMMKRRGVDNVAEISSGPAKLTKALSIDMRHNRQKIPSTSIYVADCGNGRRKYSRGPRIGISKASGLNYRFFIKENRYVSRPVREEI